MTEAEWLACDDPQKMLPVVTGGRPQPLRGGIGSNFQNEWIATDRRMRLFATACCRRIWHLLTNEVSRRAVEEAERYADGLVPPEMLRPVAQAAHSQAWDQDSESYNVHEYAAALCTEVPINAQECAQCAEDACQAIAQSDADVVQETKAQANFLRCIFGPLPFRSMALDQLPSGTALSIAHAVYDDRDFERLPILADALEDAGCTDRDILDHCRQPGEHVRGCWVVDLVLGKK